MKKLIALALCLCMVFAMTACQTTTSPSASTEPGAQPTGGSESPEAVETTGANALGDSDAMVYSSLYASEVSSLNYLIEGATNEQTVGANVIDTLVEYNSTAELVPGLAETWKCSEDGLTWTFHLRQGVMWYDYQGNPVAELTANDFVSAAKYVCDPANESATDYMILDLIAGASDYYDQVSAYYETLEEGAEMDDDASGADFGTVGIKAVDDYTLQYTTVDVYPFFPSCLTYVCYMPAYGPLLDELGQDFGTSNDKMYYCGAYILTEYEPQVKRTYEKNYQNWDADNVYITKLAQTYNAESSTLAPAMVLRGEIDYADIPTSMVDEWLQSYPEYLSKDRAVPDYSYFYCFNFRAGSGSPDRISTWEANGWEPANWDLAVSNANFRHAIMSAFDRDYSMYALEPDADARADVTQHTITPSTFTSVDGVDYSALPEFDNVDQYFFDEAKAAEYKAAAVEELTAMGVTLPVKMVISYRSDDSDWEQESILLKQQLEGVLGTDFIVCELYGAPADGFRIEVRHNGMYGFMRCNWGADYEDPSTWAQPFAVDDSVRDSDGAVECNSYNDMDIALTVESDLTPILEAYYAKVDEAKAISDTAQRYSAFAQAEAMLIENAIVVPYFIFPSSYVATKLNIFEGQYAPCGVSNLRYKGQKVHDSYITMDEYEAAYDQWLVDMGTN